MLFLLNDVIFNLNAASLTPPMAADVETQARKAMPTARAAIRMLRLTLRDSARFWPP